MFQFCFGPRLSLLAIKIRRRMVATEEEIEDIVDVLLEYFPDKSLLMRLMEDIWSDVGSYTENVSLRDTILGVKAEVESRD